MRDGIFSLDANVRDGKPSTLIRLAAIHERWIAVLPVGGALGIQQWRDIWCGLKVLGQHASMCVGGCALIDQSLLLRMTSLFHHLFRPLLRTASFHVIIS